MPETHEITSLLVAWNCVSGTQVSPDGDWLVVSSAGGRKMLFSLKTGEQAAIKGLEDRDEIVRWMADGRSVLVFRPLELPLKIYRLELTSGKKELIRTITPGNRTGVFGNIYLFTTPDAKTFLYGLRRYLFDLYVVEDLK